MGSAQFGYSRYEAVPFAASFFPSYFAHHHPDHEKPDTFASCHARQGHINCNLVVFYQSRSFGVACSKLMTFTPTTRSELADLMLLLSQNSQTMFIGLITKTPSQSHHLLNLASEILLSSMTFAVLFMCILFQGTMQLALEL